MKRLLLLAAVLLALPSSVLAGKPAVYTLVINEPSPYTYGQEISLTRLKDGVPDITNGYLLLECYQGRLLVEHRGQPAAPVPDNTFVLESTHVSPIVEAEWDSAAAADCTASSGSFHNGRFRASASIDFPVGAAP